MEEHVVQHLAKDARLAPLLVSHPPPPIPEERQGLFPALLRSVIFQQLSTKAANTIYDRFLHLFAERTPNPIAVHELTEATLRAAGISRQKARYLQHIAEFWLQPANQQVEWDHLADEEVLDRLTSIKGVGPWTAQIILLFTLQRPDVFPTQDLGLQQAITLRYALTEEGKDLQEAMQRIAAPWRPFRSYACRVLWHWYDEQGRYQK